MLFPLNLMKRVLTKSWAVLFIAFLHLLVDATLHSDARSIVQITGLGALKPNIFSVC